MNERVLTGKRYMISNALFNEENPVATQAIKGVIDLLDRELVDNRPTHKVTKIVACNHSFHYIFWQMCCNGRYVDLDDYW